MNGKSITEVVHNSVRNMHAMGVVNATTLREFDEACLPQIKELTPEEIKHLRMSNRISQAVFARLINSSLSTVRQWEIGRKKPSGVALKILNLVEHNGIKVLYS